MRANFRYNLVWITRISARVYRFVYPEPDGYPAHTRSGGTCRSGCFQGSGLGIPGRYSHVICSLKLRIGKEKKIGFLYDTGHFSGIFADRKDGVIFMGWGGAAPGFYTFLVVVVCVVVL